MQESNWSEALGELGSQTFQRLGACLPHVLEAAEETLVCTPE
jgi:hypothetical protein